MKSFWILFAALAINFNIQGQNALHFDGVNDQIQTTFPGVFGTANRTFEAWVFVNSGLTATIAIMDYGLNVTGSRNTLNIGPTYAVNYLSGGTNANISSSANAITPGQWNHVAFVLNSGTGFLYVNGVQVGTGNLTTVNTPTGGANLIIGQRVSGGSIPFLGIIDEVRVWNVARTQAQIAADMNSEYCTLPTGLVAYYKFNQGTAIGNNTGLTTLIEEVAGNNGTLQNFALLGTTSNWVLGATLGAGTIPGATLTVSECDSYTTPSGTVLTTSGSYSDTLPSVAGCDSVITIDLTIQSSTASTITASSCDSYTSPSGAVYTTSGNYTDVIVNAAGCDSTITIQLTINTVNNSVSQNGAVLTAQQSGASYQWLNCQTGFSAIAGATGQSFTATSNGNYAVRIDVNGCVDTSACTLVSGIGIGEDIQRNFQVYPNPNHGVFVAKFTDRTFAEYVRIVDLNGREVYRNEIYTSGELVIETALESGIYFVELLSESKWNRQKMIIQ
jgi:hypothetical protein